MKMKAKRVLALLFSVSMVFSSLDMSALATGMNGGESQSGVVEETSESRTDESAAIPENKPDDAAASAESSAGGTQQAEEDGDVPSEDVNTAEEENAGGETAPDAAQPESEGRTTVTVEDQQVVVTLNVDDLDVTVDPNAAMIPEAEDDVDTDSPVVSVVEEELGNMKVLNEDGESVALTEEQIQTVLYLYQQYLDQWKDNANLLGVQTPFFLQYNDKKDGLGALGEMLVLAGYTVDDVRSGKYSYDDLVGMIQNFYYADEYGLKFYSDAIAKSRDEVLELVKESGAETLVQKMLVINDWLAQIDTFDMSYIMNMGEDEPIMKAQNPQKHEHYDEIYDAMYDLYEEQIRQQFHDQIYDGIVAQFRQQYYEGAIKQIVAEGYKSQVRQQVHDQYMADNSEATEDDADAAADAYMEANAEQIDKEASAYADQYMEENADAISEDAAGFVEKNFGSEVAAQISAGADDFIKDAEENGVEVDPENAPGVKMTIEDITKQQMDQPLEDLNGMSPNEAIPVYAKQAAQGLTEGIIGAWEGNHIGVLAEGASVCCGYAKAFAYLMQYMTPEVYGVDGEDTDMSVAANWKSAEKLYYDANGNLNIDQGYIVDLVRITFDADVTMYGELNEGFNSDHFWNAVKVDGKWYYVDPCYTDVYTEVMSRDRVEMDGTMNHMYFMFSHTTALELYDGNMLEDEEGNAIGIKTLYADAATDQSYESSWYSRIASNAYSDGKSFYYLYDSTDMLEMMRSFDDLGGDSGDSGDSGDIDYEQLLDMQNAEYKIVRHDITGTDVVKGKDGDSDYEALIEFNHPVNEDEDTTVARVYNPDNGEMVENEFLTELFAQYKDECDIYPSIKLSTALYDGKLYFNLSNVILSYDLKTGALDKVKEYNTVYGKRDDTVAFGGMAFSVVDSKEDADFTVVNHPIASMAIKNDGKMYVSISTNFAYISGKDPHDYADSDENGYGYEFEESNYNPDYSRYMEDTGYSDSELEGMGYTPDKNDNDEFMWSAVFVDTFGMSDLVGCDHTYETVTVEPFCGRGGFTEERCSKCGEVKDDTKKADQDTALEHHYIHFDETYYNKDDNGEWITGDCYVCTVCGFAISEPSEPADKNEQESEEDYQERLDEYEAEKAIYDEAAAAAGHVYEPADGCTVTWSEDNTSAEISSGTLVCSPCEGRPLDVLEQEGNETSITLAESRTLEEVTTEVSGNCKDGLTTVYTASGTTDNSSESKNNKIRVSKSETGEPGEHSYKAEFTWAEAEEGSEVPYTATAVLTCESCGEKVTDLVAAVALDEEVSVDATCTEDGTAAYKASVEYDGKTYTDIKTDTIKASGSHSYNAEWTWTEEKSDDGTVSYKASVVLTCSKCELKSERKEAAVQLDEHKNPTCEEAGKDVYIATVTYEDQIYTDTKEVEIPATGHAYAAEWTWTEVKSDDGTASYKASVVLTCTACGDKTESIEAKVTLNDDEHVNPTCEDAGKDVYVASADYEEETYTDKKEVEIPATGHTWKYEDTGAVETHKSTCTVCDKEVDEPHEFIDGICDKCGAAAHIDVSAPSIKSVYSTQQTSVKVTWSAVDDVDGYELYRATNPEADGLSTDSKDEELGMWFRAKTIGGSSVTEYTNQGLTVGQTYYYKVRAYVVNAKNQKVYSEFSDVDYMPAAVVFNNVYSNSSSRIRILWNEVSGAHGYQIWRMNDDGAYSIVKTLGDKGNELTDDQGATTAYSNTGLESGKSYTYRMRAFKIENGKKVFGSYSSEFKVAVMPEAPKLTVASDKISQAALSWNTADGAAGYQIWMSEGEENVYSIAKSVTDGDVTSYTKYDLTSGKTYGFKIRAYTDVDGKKTFGAYSEPVSVTIK